MKKLSLLLVLFSSQAFAFPTVGDWARFETVTKDHGVTKTKTQGLEIVKYDASSDSFTVMTTDLVDGTTTTTMESVPREKMVPTSQDQQELRDCFWHDIGGVPTFVNVPAGRLYACRFRYKDRKQHLTTTAWLADAPFGFVKVTQSGPDGFSEVREMIGFGRGK